MGYVIIDVRKNLSAVIVAPNAPAPNAPRNLVLVKPSLGG